MSWFAKRARLFGENLKDAHRHRRRRTGGEPGRRYGAFSVARNSVTTVTLDESSPRARDRRLVVHELLPLSTSVGSELTHLDASNGRG
jgi:hypothetical protein